MVAPEPRSSGPRAPVPRPPVPPRRRQWLDELRFRLTDPRVGAVGLGLVAIAAGAFWYVTSLRSGDADSGTAAASADATVLESTDRPTAEGADDELVIVHVAGAVAEPGVIELPAGSRVIDAVEAVGGARAEGDLDRLNLAAALTDGQRVVVPLIGQPLAPADATDGATDVAGDGGLLDLNTATREQLEELPGIGPALAEAILAEREKRGGFQSVDDLKGVRGIGEKRFADIEDLVTVP